MERENEYYATGRRKSAIARAWLQPGKGTITINNQPLEKYFTVDHAKMTIKQPLVLTNNTDAFDIKVRVRGGGISGQAGAIRLGITRALILSDPELRTSLKKAGFVKRDARVKERKKYGQKGARARFQFSKR